MSENYTVLITGACGNLGTKLRHHLDGRYELHLLDLDPKGDPDVVQADFSEWDFAWASTFRGVDTVVHLAAATDPAMDWPAVVAPNLDSVLNVYNAAIVANVRRVVFASSNHAMGRYLDIPEPHVLTTDIPQRPGTRMGGERDSLPYGAAKLMGERIGKCYADVHGLSTIAVRIGWVHSGENPNPGMGYHDPWLSGMWMSNRDFCQLFEKCITADPAIRFAIINGMSANEGMRWDIEHTQEVVGYEPEDGVGRG